MTELKPLAANTVLYCRRWEETVRFYKETLGFSVNFSRNRFVEFSLTDTARLTIADETRTTIKSSDQKGMLLTFQVAGIEGIRKGLKEKGADPSPVTLHAWGAWVFYLSDPEGHGIEFWELV